MCNSANDTKKVIGYCAYCKENIYEGEKYIVDEEGKLLHRYCDELIDNFDNNPYQD